MEAVFTAYWLGEPSAFLLTGSPFISPQMGDFLRNTIAELARQARGKVPPPTYVAQPA